MANGVLSLVDEVVVCVEGRCVIQHLGVVRRRENVKSEHMHDEIVEHQETQTTKIARCMHGMHHPRWELSVGHLELPLKGQSTGRDPDSQRATVPPVYCNDLSRLSQNASASTRLTSTTSSSAT
jgi:hypothetical protein